MAGYVYDHALAHQRTRRTRRGLSLLLVCPRKYLDAILVLRIGALSSGHPLLLVASTVWAWFSDATVKTRDGGMGTGSGRVSTDRLVYV